MKPTMKPMSTASGKSEVSRREYRATFVRLLNCLAGRFMNPACNQSSPCRSVPRYKRRHGGFFQEYRLSPHSCLP